MQARLQYDLGQVYLWKKIVICVVNVTIGAYKEVIATKVNGKPVVAHIYKYTEPFRVRGNIMMVHEADSPSSHFVQTVSVTRLGAQRWSSPLCGHRLLQGVEPEEDSLTLHVLNHR